MSAPSRQRRLHACVLALCVFLGLVGVAPAIASVPGFPAVAPADSRADADDGAVALQTSRSTTVVGAPVSFRLSPPTSATWSATLHPGNDSVPLVAHPDGRSVVARPTRPGTLTVTATTPDGTRLAATVAVSSRSQLVERYAPVLHYDASERYRPTRYEALIHRSTLVRLTGNGSPDVLVRGPTVFDLAGRDDSTALVLQGDETDYPAYDDAYNATVYASVHENVAFEGETYTAVTYWLFYVHDPKTGAFSKYAAHQSDIESVTVLVGDDGPRWVGASQHYGGEVIEWAKAPHSGTHLHVYPAVGAHSNYLVDTGEYDGSGIFVQVQHVVDPTGPNPGSGSFSPVYQDRTGDDVVLRHDAASPDDSYDLVPLTGTERWASFRGAMEGTSGKGRVPTQQARWRDPGQWMHGLVPDESQVTLVAEVLTLEVWPSALTGEVEFQNLGSKPRTVWVVLDAKPADSAWSDPSTVTLTERPVDLGTGAVANVSYEGSYPHAGAERWDLRVRVLGYPPSLSEPEDVYFDYRSEYPATVPPDGLDLAAQAPTTNSWHLPVFVSTYFGGAPLALLLAAGVVLVVVVRRLR